MKIGESTRLSPNARARTVAVGLMLMVAAVLGHPQVTTALAAVTEYSLGNTSGPNGLTLGPDGNVWVAESDGNMLASVTPAGVVVAYPAPNPWGVVSGPDGNLWFTDLVDSAIGRFNIATHVVTTFATPTGAANPIGITLGSDGNLWFVESKLDKVGRITTAGVRTEFPVLTTGSLSEAITAGPDGNLWVAEHLADKIAKVTTAGVATEYALASGSSPRGISPGPDGNVWFTESLGEKVARITPAGTITEFPVPNAAGKPHPRGITTGIDGRIWFAEDDGASVYSLTTSGVFSSPYPIASPTCTPFQLTVGSDGAVWLIENIPGKVAQVQTGPGSPVASATPGNGSATVNWTAPLSGGSAITGYAVDAYQGAILASSTPAAANAVSATVSGLPNGAVYSFKVTASNAIDSGPPATTNRVTIGMVEIAVPTLASGMFYMTPGPGNRVWFTEADAGALGASTAGGTISEYPATTAGSFPYGIAAGADGNAWFTELNANNIGRSTPTGTVTELAIPTGGSLPEGIGAGPDGALWFVERGANKIGRVTTGGIISNEIPIPTASSYPEFITAGPDGAMWFTERNANKIGRIPLTTPFTVTEYTIPTASSGPQGIVLGPDGALWFTESFGDRIGRITTSGVFTEHALPTAIALPKAITVGQDEALWFTENNGNAIGRITLSGAVSEYPISTSGSGLTGIASFGGQIWFTENLANKIGHTAAGPSAPSGVTAIAGDASATVSWTPPASGGSAITGYTVTSTPGSIVASAPANASSVNVGGLSNGTTYTFTVAAANSVGAGPGSSPSNAVTPSGPSGSVYTPVVPYRALDTRPSVQVGPYSTPLAGGPANARPVQITGTGGVGGVPASGVTAVVLNVTIAGPTAGGYLTVWPSGSPQPLASNLNWGAGAAPVPNLVQVALGPNGQVMIATYAGTVDVIVDVAGYFSAPTGTGQLYEPLAPQRVIDTRATTPVGPGGILQVQITGAHGVPAAALVEAVVLNVTVTRTTAPSYMTVYPSDATRPTASNLNWSAGQTIPNRVTVKVGATGAIKVYNSIGSTDVVIDVNGYFTAAGNASAGFKYYPLTPYRILDTRPNPIGQDSSIHVQVTGTISGGTVPGDAAAVVTNATVTDTNFSSFLTVWPTGITRPTASDLNWDSGATVPNLTPVQIGSGGQIDAYNYGGVADLIVDVNGYYR